MFFLLETKEIGMLLNFGIGNIMKYHYCNCYDHY